MDRQVTIEGTTYRFVKVRHKTCDNCDIFKAAPPRIFDSPLCCKYNTRGNRSDTDYGLVVNLCARHRAYLFKKIK